MTKLTHRRLTETLTYDRDTGFFYKIGTETQVGYTDKDGYIIVSIDGTAHRANRLAFFYEHGYLPENKVDHKNRDVTDNSIDNLREVSDTCSVRNRGLFSCNTSGVTGVCFHKKNRKFTAYIRVNYKHNYLGSFQTKLEAACHRLAAEQCLRWNACDASSETLEYVRAQLKQ